MSKDLCFKIIKKESLNKIRFYRDSHYEEVLNYTFFLASYLDYVSDFVKDNCENLYNEDYYISNENIEKLIELSKIKNHEDEYKTEIVLEFIKYLDIINLESHERLVVNLDC